MMQAAWFMTLFVFSIVFFLVFIVIYFFRPRKDDKIVPESLMVQESADPEDIVPRSPRAEPNWSAMVQTADGENLAVNVANISRGSAFVSCANPLPVGDTFQLTIDIPERQPIKVKAEVIWSNGHLPESKVVKRGMGIRLVGADTDDIQFLDSTIKNHPALSDPGAGADSEDKSSAS
jgi:Tfp pilus assembly protein PilZ